MTTVSEPVALPAPASVLPSGLSAQIKKRLSGTDREFTLEVDFALSPGVTILFGASGAGKTTLLDCLAGLTRPDSGHVAIANQNWFDDRLKINIPTPARRIGYVFQDLALFPHLSVEANVQYGLSRLDTSERAARTDLVLESFRIAHLCGRKPGEISGGERQRVALARALVTDPRLLLLDEPLAGLDAPTKSKIVDDLRTWNSAHVTHDREEVFALGERVLVLENGRMIAQGTPHEVMTAPRLELVAQLAGFENIFDAIVIAAHEDRGTMTCRLSGSHIELETPMVRADIGTMLRIGIRAGDILLATVRPQGISARNLIPGTLVSVEQRDVRVIAKVDCGVEMEIHLTLAARDSLGLEPGGEIWLVLKTHSCHLMAR
ncbi:MAG: molybdenum ABC transporter ATP-binding protein [Acidobacteria bacterium]|nr:MAG: molybdenum ABC transporter ATP-binding protein [Acidobacteriota bacterium]